MPRWELEKEFTFEAAHRLPKHDGKCARLHGHSWKGRIEVSGDTLQTTGPKSGMLMDYTDMKSALKDLIENYLDHWYLNETTGLENPTSEELARWICDQLQPLFTIKITCVVIEETCTSACRYYP